MMKLSSSTSKADKVNLCPLGAFPWPTTNHTAEVTSLMFFLWPLDFSLHLNGLTRSPRLPPGPAKQHWDEALIFKPGASWFYIEHPEGRQVVLPGRSVRFWHVREVSTRCLNELSWIWECCVEGVSPSGHLQHRHLCCCFQFFPNDICFKNAQTPRNIKAFIRVQRQLKNINARASLSVFHHHPKLRDWTACSKT